MAQLDGPGIAAIIVGGGAAAASIIGAFRLQRSVKASEPSADEQRQRPTPEQVAAVPEDSDGQRELMALFQQDNKDLRQEIREMKEREKTITRTLMEMKDDIEADKRWKTEFLEALARWIGKIYMEWGKGGPFPYPEKNDAVILNDVIPRS